MGITSQGRISMIAVGDSSGSQQLITRVITDDLGRIWFTTLLLKNMSIILKIRWVFNVRLLNLAIEFFGHLSSLIFEVTWGFITVVYKVNVAGEDMSTRILRFLNLLDRLNTSGGRYPTLPMLSTCAVRIVISAVFGVLVFFHFYDNFIL